MDRHIFLENFINNNPEAIGKVVDFDAGTDRLFSFDFTAASTELTTAIIADTQKFSDWVNNKLKTNNCRYGIGGYMEHRTIYAVSPHFDTDDEPRRLHLGVDIWGDAGTPVYTPLEGTVHSFQDNGNLGDYGPAIILQHDLDGLTLYSLYGHLSRKSLKGLTVGMLVSKNQQIGTLGNNQENGQWPPHLHFQLMFDMEGKYGDYPGVCRYSEKEKYRLNVPDPGLVLKFSWFKFRRRAKSVSILTIIKP
ncbi:peptidoglycan DD-metalloendopeptidase family protein [Mucilaginibacter sabulilitoris]|uniref:Peptidoglycan DD-metalloendopeptidase family protein n=1 Tax=Mucilaginibacter sabulilitoris TaxID=1173583 RepID=A0ABZ0TS19_9SPHI|nr:peptidoglycan DD-metalloendopeptidase family protein [Mucilaginibacter sabulilitoris]WPU94564.1 peptidoglycan DD-metalloendopeptidase family protein [Mucilaginibacter sabulilitoris]